MMADAGTHNEICVVVELVQRELDSSAIELGDLRQVTVGQSPFSGLYVSPAIMFANDERHINAEIIGACIWQSQRT